MFRVQTPDVVLILSVQKPAVVAIDTQVQHHERKIQNTEKIIETIQRDAKKQQDTLERYQRDLAEIKKAADEAQSKSLLRTLGVLAELVPRGPTEGITNWLSAFGRPPGRIPKPVCVELQALPASDTQPRKSQATTEAVTERQQVEQLTREQKTKYYTLGNLQSKWDEFTERKATLQQEWETWSETVKEV